MASLPVTNEVVGAPESAKNRALETGAGHVQSLAPPTRLCAHLNAFHAYANGPGFIETNHYCAHLNDEVRQCILYDSDKPGARLIGVEYMITPRIFETLDEKERKLWHSHVFEVKSGMLFLPSPSGVPDAAWELAENKEMEQVVHLYGKVWNLWSVDRGDLLPLGEPQLMTSFTNMDQFPEFDEAVAVRDKKFGIDYKKKAEQRQYIQEPEVHPDADWSWKLKQEKKA